MPPVKPVKVDSYSLDAGHGDKVSRPAKPPGEDIVYHPDFLSSMEASMYLKLFLTTIIWKQEYLTVYGREVRMPRLTAWYGERGLLYTYSGSTSVAHPWTHELKQLRDRVEARSGCVFNSVLLNLYRDGSDSVSWHSDDETELGATPVIASISLGQVRRFQLKGRKDTNTRLNFNLGHGSLLLMRGNSQIDWLHRVPKETRACAARINLTFRRIITA